MSAPAPPLVLTVPDAPGGGPWVDCSRLGPNPEVQLSETAGAGDLVELQQSASASAVVGKMVSQVLGGQPSKTLLTEGSPQAVGSFAFARAYRLPAPSGTSPTTGLTLNLASSNLSPGASNADRDAAVIFDEGAPRNLRSARPVQQSPIDNTKNGIVNLSSNTGSAVGATADFATIAGGNRNEASGEGATVGGGKVNVASGSFSTIAGGSDNVASQAGAFCAGQNNIASNTCAMALGLLTRASGAAALSEGNATLASGAAAHAEGDTTTASGNQAHAEGLGTTASSTAAHAEGRNTTASAVTAHAEGFISVASGQASHAEGTACTASADSSHAGGQFAAAIRIGQQSHAAGSWSGGAAGEAQAWGLVLRGFTAGGMAGESVELTYGPVGARLALENGTGYTFRLRVIAKGSIGGTQRVRSWTQTLCVHQEAGVLSIAAAGAQEAIGDAAAVTWTLVASVAAGPFLAITFTTGATTSAARCVCAVEVTEVLSL